MKLWDKPLTMLLRISVLLVLAYLVAGPTVQHAVTATLLPQTGLNPSPIDPRVRFDPGTDALAQAVARLLPQAVALSLPGLGSRLITLLHGSALAFWISVIEITGKANLVAASTYQFVEAFIAAAAIYWLISLSIERTLAGFERRQRRTMARGLA